MSDNALRAAMASKAKARKDPEFYEAQKDLTLGLQWATQMKEAGRLTAAEFREYESHLTSAYLDSLPVEDFVELQKSGAYSDLETIARRIPDDRDSFDVLKERAALDKKVRADALDEFFAAQKISSKKYNEEHKKLGSFDDDRTRTRRINDIADDGDHDEPAYETFFNRTLPPGDTEPLPAPDTDRIKSADED